MKCSCCSSFHVTLLYVLSRQNDQSDGTSVQPEEGGSSNAVADEENDRFWGLDDIAGSQYSLIHFVSIFVQSSTELDFPCSGSKKLLRQSFRQRCSFESLCEAPSKSSCP